MKNLFVFPLRRIFFILFLTAVLSCFQTAQAQNIDFSEWRLSGEAAKEFETFISAGTAAGEAEKSAFLKKLFCGKFPKQDAKLIFKTSGMANLQASEKPDKSSAKKYEFSFSKTGESASGKVGKQLLVLMQAQDFNLYKVVLTYKNGAFAGENGNIEMKTSFAIAKGSTVALGGLTREEIAGDRRIKSVCAMFFVLD